MARTIREGRGQSVALKGPYGSGKSTTVELMRRQFREDENTGVFVYDAWVHEGDSLRQSFLEELVEFLRAQRWDEKDEVGESGKAESRWEKELGRTKSRETIKRGGAKTHLSPFIAGLAVAAALLPLAAVFLSPTTSVMALGEVQLLVDSNTRYVLGWVVLTLAVACAFGGAGVRWRQAQEAKKKTESREEEGDAMKFDWFTFVTRQNRETNWEEVTKRAGPSAKEFRNAFELLLEDALASRQGEERCLVIVVDNLDRLSPSRAFEAWTTLQVFFETQNRKIEEDGWRRKFWLIVPFDPAAIEKASSGTDARRHSLQDFIDKTFQVTFRVTAPVVYHQEKFVQDQLRESFPAREHEEEREKILRLLMRSETKASPRKIKRIINDLVALYRQWGDDAIPLSIQSYYVIEYMHGSRSLGGRVDKDVYPPAKDRLLLRDRDWLMEMYALNHGVHPKQATHIVLRPQIHEALEEGNADQLSSWEQKKIAGFHAVVAQQVRVMASGGASISVANAASAISSLEWDGEEGRQRSAKEALVKAAFPLEDWSIVSPQNNPAQVGMGIANVVGYAREVRGEAQGREVSAQVLRALSKSTPRG